MRGGRDFAPDPDGFRAGDTLVAAIELVGREHHHADLATAHGRGAVEARAVQYEADIAHVVATRQRLHDGLGIGHLRDAARIDETRDLDAPDAGVDGAADEFQLDGRGDGGGLVLQAVARADFDDPDALRR